MPLHIDYRENRMGAINFRLLLLILIVAVAATGAGFLVGFWLGG